jgi:hypothetical protein
MKCPHCGNVISSISCPGCGGEIPEKSLFCCWCGNPVKKEEQVQIDSSERIPCSDGNCIGTVNEKGACNICGKPYARNPA